jgi:hypothetical protein
VTEYPVLDVTRVVEFAGRIVEPVDADVVEQASRPDKLGVKRWPVTLKQLFRHGADDAAVRVNGLERCRCRRISLVQGTDLVVRRDTHD